MTTISVVMPVRNGARFITEAIRSALDQGVLVTQIIVVDDASTDNTVETVRAIADARVTIVANRTRGLPAGRNTGAALCTGEWLYFLDSDDRVRPGALAKLLTAAETLPNADAIYGDYERIDAQGKKLGNRTILKGRRKPSGFILPDLLRGNFMIVGAQIVRRSAFEEAGGFEESLKFCEDWHFWCRLSSITDFHHVQGHHVIDYRIHGASMMHKEPRPFSDVVPALDAVFADPLVRSQLPAYTLAALRPVAEASMLTYLATESIRLRCYSNALRSAIEAIRHAPAETPKVFARVAGTFAGL